MHHGDYIMEQLVMVLRSAAFFENAPYRYGMWLDDGNAGRYAGDSISIVTASSGFMKPDHDLAQGLHRIQISIEKNKDYDEAVAIRALPFLSVKEFKDVDPWFVSSEVIGMDCRVYNFKDEDWEDEWPNTNHIPALVEITLFIDPPDERGPAIKLQRAVEIPLGTTNWLTKGEVNSASGKGKDKEE